MAEKKLRTMRLVVEAGAGRIILERQRQCFSLVDLEELLGAAAEWAGGRHMILVSIHTGLAPKEPRLR
jgi:hypothetical protein